MFAGLTRTVVQGKTQRNAHSASGENWTSSSDESLAAAHAGWRQVAMALTSNGALESSIKNKANPMLYASADSLNDMPTFQSSPWLQHISHATPTSAHIAPSNVDTSPKWSSKNEG